MKEGNGSPLRNERVERLLALGREALDAGEPGTAVNHLQQAFKEATGDIEVMSWYGLSLALAGVDRLRGVALCEASVRKAGHKPTGDMMNNLGRAYLAARYRTQAIRVLRRGAALDPDHQGIHATLEEMGIRRPPVLRFLKRSHPLNKYLGILRERLFPRNREENLQ